MLIAFGISIIFFRMQSLVHIFKRFPSVDIFYLVFFLLEVFQNDCIVISQYIMLISLTLSYIFYMYIYFSTFFYKACHSETLQHSNVQAHAHIYIENLSDILSPH